jgi:hypothetical protein
MSGTANPSPLPDDVREALGVAVQFLDCLRDICKTLHGLGFFLGCTAARQVQMPDGVYRHYRSPQHSDRLVSEVEHVAEALRPKLDRLRGLGLQVDRAAHPLRGESAKVGKGRAGRWVFPNGLMPGLSGIETDLAISIDMQLLKSRKPSFGESDFKAVTERFEPYLDELDAEVLREAQMVAFNRERDKLLSAGKQPEPQKPVAKHTSQPSTPPPSGGRNIERDAEVVRLKKENPSRKAGQIAHLIRSRNPDWSLMENGKPFNAGAVRAILKRARDSGQI